MSFRAHFDAHLQWMQRASINDVLNGNYDDEKLRTHAGKMSIPYEEFEDAIDSGNIFAAYILAKDPTRQNPQEEFQARYVNERVGYDAVRILSKQNKMRFQFNGHSTRSVDAEIRIGNQTYYANMKLLTNSGGHQTQQRKEVKDFLTIASQHTTKHLIGWIDESPGHGESPEYYIKGAPIETWDRLHVFNSDTLVAFIERKLNETSL